MDLNDLRVAVTLLSFAIFIGIVAWAMARRRRDAFDAAARLPFEADDLRNRLEGRHE